MGNSAAKTSYAEDPALVRKNVIVADRQDSIESPVSDAPGTVIIAGGDLEEGLPFYSSISSVSEVEKGLPLSSTSSTVTEVETASAVSSVSDRLASPTSLDISTHSRDTTFSVKQWDGQKYYADYVREGLRYLKKDDSNVLMLYESPSSSSTDTSFYSSEVFSYHDFPSFPWYYKSVLAPCRYSIMNGDAYPSYLRDTPPAGLVEHWAESVPGFVTPTFSWEIGESTKVYAYLPVEHLNLDNHINKPHVHYHLAGKDAIHLMTNKTTRLLDSTHKGHRPYVAKVTHAMGSKGIFVIRNDQDEADFNEFLAASGNPAFVVTEFVEIARNVACHFFIHPSGEVIWFGSNENILLPDGDWSTDSTIVMADQEHLKEMQLPYVKDVVQYCRSLGFWGFCGIDVLFDKDGTGYVVDVNPRVTGTCPALMVAQKLQEKYGFEFALFRRNSGFAFRGSAQELLEQTRAHNEKNEGKSRVVLHSFHENDANETLVNIAVYGQSLEVCEAILNGFAPKRV